MRFLTVLLLLLAVVCSTGSAQAQGYPTKPIRVITANSAGGTSDIFMRAFVLRREHSGECGR